MHTQEPFYTTTEKDSTALQSLIHPSLQPYLLGIRFDDINSDEVKRIFSDNTERVWREIVAAMRAQGVMK